jgi:hypothetical protein
MDTLIGQLTAFFLFLRRCLFVRRCWSRGSSNQFAIRCQFEQGDPIFCLNSEKCPLPIPAIQQGSNFRIPGIAEIGRLLRLLQG